MSDVKRWRFQRHDGEILLWVNDESQDDVDPDDWAELVLGTDYDALKAERDELKAEVERLAREVDEAKCTLFLLKFPA